MKKIIYSVLLTVFYLINSSLNVSANNVGEMMRYYDMHKGTYLFTVNASEIEKLRGFSYMQPQGAVFTTASSGTPMYRYFHQKTGRYVFTGKQSEIAKMTKNGWVYEGFAFYSGGNVPIYRLYDYATGQHFYTGKASEIDEFTRKGWVNEGIGFYAVSLPTVTETKIEKRIVVTPFTQISRTSDDVPTGKTEVTTPGVNGETEETYRVIYVNGVKQSEVKTNSRLITAMVPQVETVGIGLPTYIQSWDDFGKQVVVKETDPTQDTVAEVKRLNTKTLHLLHTYNYRTNQWIPVYTPEEINRLMTQYFDVNKYNQEFYKLLTAHRATYNMKPLEIGELDKQAAQIRANEQAAIKNLRSNGVAHARPNGTSYKTVVNEVPGLKNKIASENVLAKSQFSLYDLVHEDIVAQSTFTQWKNSEGHNTTMLRYDLTHFGVALGVSSESFEHGKEYGFIAVTIFSKVRK